MNHSHSRHVFGDFLIERVVEQSGPGFAPDMLYPDWDPAVLVPRVIHNVG